MRMVSGMRRNRMRRFVASNTRPVTRARNGNKNTCKDLCMPPYGGAYFILTKGGLISFENVIADRKRGQREEISNDASIIAQSVRIRDRKVSGKIDRRKGPFRRKRTPHFPSTNRNQDSSNFNWKVSGMSSAMNSEARDFWGHSNMGFGRKKRNKKRNELKHSSLHSVAFAASTSVTEECSNAVAIDRETDVISLSDEEGSNDMKAGTEFALLEQDGDFSKQLGTPLLVKKEVPKCLTVSDELGRRRLLGSTICGRTDNTNIREHSAVSRKNSSAEKMDNYNGFCGKTEAVPELVGSIKLINTAGSNLIAGNSKQIKVDGKVCNENKYVPIQVPLRDDPLLIRKNFFDELNLLSGTREFVRNGKIELKIDKPEGENFIHLALFECCGPLEDPKHVSRGGYKICASAILHRNTSVEVMRRALIDLAEELERISRNSFNSGEILRYPVNKYSLPYLQKQHIYPLKEMSVHFPRAVYYCRLCQYHICSVSQAVTHFLSRQHIDNREKEDSLEKLRCLPEPTKQQMFKIDQVIRESYVFTRLTDAQYEVGSQIAKLLSHFLRSGTQKNFSVALYGSYLTRLATPRSNLNLVLNFPQEYSLGRALSQVTEVLNNMVLEEDFTVRSITPDFQRPDPSIHCIVNSVAVVISTSCIQQQRSTQLINFYCSICSQFRILATVFRSWAEVCSLTNIQLGGLPKLAFDILLIYYLQRKGLLPFVFEMLNEEEILLLDSESLQFERQVDNINAGFVSGSEEWNFGELWIGLFRYYAVQHPVEELIQIRWKKRHLLEDNTRRNKKHPFAPDHIMQPQQSINGYFSSCFLSTYIYFSLPRTTVCSLIPYSVIKPSTLYRNVKKKQRYGSRKTTVMTDSGTDKAAPSNDRQNSGSNDIDIKNTQMSKTQVAEAGINKHEVDALTKADLETLVQSWTNEDENGNSLASGKFRELTVSDCADSHLDVSTSYNDLQGDDANETYCDNNVPSTSQQHNFSELSSEKEQLSRLASASILKIRFHDYDDMSVRKLWLTLNNNEYNYSWSLDYFTGGLEPILRCTCCDVNGHLRKDCPELMIPRPKSFPPLTNAQKKIIDVVISNIFSTMRIRPYYVRNMSMLCHELEGYLRRFYRADCRLSLFGSAGNGFGLLGSDADICLQFRTRIRPGDIDSAEVIYKVAEVIRRMPGVIFVYEIPHAKVPIVKFRYCNRLEADVSLYNVLALENTRLLRTYSKIDVRIRMLGIMTKIWAKSCEIGNASKGSLSSYSYIIMLIHYLQRTNPPVAPFLQEIAPPGKCREPVIIDDCNVYFCSFEDLEWKIYNRSTVGELWISFLDYFGTKFDFTQEVIQIRQSQPLMKLDKGWQSRPIAIEDPFDLTHNLSSGVHSKTMVYIQKSFVQSREKFGTLSVPNSKLNHKSLVLYTSTLLSSCRVGNGPPLDRNCCYRCRRIGHFVTDCPLGMKNNKHR
ncbi:unnamed protein product [Litomosoides sigmodontis]|uniref:CCHC-type domain-containing protein n=1 Tax=Litomosoides sigmodontis TaxID=42156 RepID=A0A3P6SSW2_LITSI|nr:unnamed protein product [Litomosoides sigmodontis]